MKYPKKNERSAKSHGNEHTKTETKQGFKYEKILQFYAQQTKVKLDYEHYGTIDTNIEGKHSQQKQN